jgi:hypothetical protein
MGRKHHHALGVRRGSLGSIGVISVGFATWPSSDGMLEIIENFNIGIVSRAIQREQLGESILVIVFIGKFENGFFRFLAKPNQGRAGELVVPLTTGNEPWMHYSRELSGRVKVDYDMRVVVRLQERGGYGVSDFTLHRLPYDTCLGLAPSRKIYGARVEDGRNAHGDGTRWDALLRAKTHGHLLAGHVVDENEARGGRGHRARLIGSDVAHTANAQQHDIDTTRLRDASLVPLARILHHVLRHHTVGRENIPFIYVDMVQKTIAQLSQAGMYIILGQGEILVSIEDNDIGEAKPLLAMTTYKLIENEVERYARAQPQDAMFAGRPLGFYLSLYGVGNVFGSIFRPQMDGGGYLFASSEL